MVMPGADNKRKERDDTDASLRAERIKADAQLAKTRTSVEEEADHVVEVARDRAEVTLHAARERADSDMATAGAPSSLRKEVEVERAVEDGAVAEERAVADEQLQGEREEHQGALTTLLRLEREATDDGLVIERARADETVATRDDFLGMVSHDLRNMLGGITLSATMLVKQAATEANGGAATLRHAELIKRFSVRMNRLVGDLLDLVSLEAGKLRVTPQPLDAVQLVKDSGEEFQPSFSAKGVTLTTDIAADAILAKIDHERIHQVLANLLGNALKFTERGGNVALSVARTGSEVRFSVTDTGVGIPAGQAAAIFERFRQVGTNDGLGLGLYIAKCIVEAHGGSIWAETPERGGTALLFTLPGAGADPA